MKPQNVNRNVWIVLVFVLVLACGCVCLVVLGGAALYLLTQPATRSFEFSEPQVQRIVRTFETGDEPTLDLATFAGSITVRAGEEDAFGVVAIKRARQDRDIAQIDVEMEQWPGKLVVRATRAQTRTVSNVSVDFEITAPPDTRLELRTAAGNIDVRGIRGGVLAHSSAGNIDVRGASGEARLDVGAGDVRYEGRPADSCSFKTGAGNIRLRVPADTGAQVDLSTGIGKVSVDWEVKGQVTPRHVDGAIGDGSQADIQAHSGAGNVTLERQ